MSKVTAESSILVYGHAVIAAEVIGRMTLDREIDNGYENYQWDDLVCKLDPVTQKPKAEDIPDCLFANILRSTRRSAWSLRALWSSESRTRILTSAASVPRGAINSSLVLATRRISASQRRRNVLIFPRGQRARLGIAK